MMVWLACFYLDVESSEAAENHEVFQETRPPRAASLKPSQEEKYVWKQMKMKTEKFWHKVILL